MSRYLFGGAGAQASMTPDRHKGYAGRSER